MSSDYLFHHDHYRNRTLFIMSLTSATAADSPSSVPFARSADDLYDFARADGWPTLLMADVMTAFQTPPQLVVSGLPGCAGIVPLGDVVVDCERATFSDCPVAKLVGAKGAIIRVDRLPEFSDAVRWSASIAFAGRGDCSGLVVEFRSAVMTVADHHAVPLQIPLTFFALTPPDHARDRESDFLAQLQPAKLTITADQQRIFTPRRRRSRA